MESTLIAALVSILVVIISAYATFYGLKITKENKIAEMRQVWIDELRKDISEYIAYALEFSFYYSNIRSNSGCNSRDAINDHFSKNSHIVDSAFTRIILRLDSNGHANMLKILSVSYKDYIDMLNNDKYSADLANHLTELRNEAVSVLDSAWETINTGEKDINKIIKNIPYVAAVAVLIIGLTFLGIYYVLQPQNNSHRTSTNAKCTAN